MILELWSNSDQKSKITPWGGDVAGGPTVAGLADLVEQRDGRTLAGLPVGLELGIPRGTE
jgi:hypothetical protein